METKKGFYRLPESADWDLENAFRMMELLKDNHKAGNDFNNYMMEMVMQLLKDIQAKASYFESKEDFELKNQKL